MDYRQLVFSGHAIRQMFHRVISKDDVTEVIRNGQAPISETISQKFENC